MSSPLFKERVPEGTVALIEQLRVLAHNDALTQGERETIYEAMAAAVISNAARP